MQESLKLLREKWRSESNKWPLCVQDMRMRIGINTGEIVVGNMGSKKRMNYTMMGDSVNLAARLEEAAKQYGVYVYISEYTYQYVEELFIARKIDYVRVVGKSEPVTTYELLGEKGRVSNDLEKLIEIFSKAMSYYESREWQKAIEKFKESEKLEHSRYPDLQMPLNPSVIYIKRCEKFLQDPPADDWDGVYVLTEK